MVDGSLRDRKKRAEDTLAKQLWEVEPRFQLFKRIKQQDCKEDTFRPKIKDDCSRCQVKHRDYLLHKALDDAMVVHQTFLGRVRVELKQLFGNVGTNVTMQKLVAAAALCWDWSVLAFNRPTPEPRVPAGVQSPPVARCDVDQCVAPRCVACGALHFCSILVLRVAPGWLALCPEAIRLTRAQLSCVAHCAWHVLCYHTSRYP